MTTPVRLLAAAPAGALRFVRFLISGGLATGVMFAGSYLFLMAGLRPFAANLAAYAIAFGVGYSLQRGWTFGGRHAHGSALPRYFILQASTATVTAVAGEFAASALPPLAVSLGSAVLAGAICFVGNSLWVFPDRNPEPVGEQA